MTHEYRPTLDGRPGTCDVCGQPLGHHIKGLAACAPGSHVPASVGEFDLGVEQSRCVICVCCIVRDSGDVWRTPEQLAEVTAEERAEAKREELVDLEEALHPEWHCPPRE